MANGLRPGPGGGATALVCSGEFHEYTWGYEYDGECRCGHDTPVPVLEFAAFFSLFPENSIGDWRIVLAVRGGISFMRPICSRMQKSRLILEKRAREELCGICFGEKFN